MIVARLRLARMGGTAAAREACPTNRAPQHGAPTAPHEPPSPNPLAPQQPLYAAPAMSVAAAKPPAAIEVYE
jgi:hypothetical protein